jgi:hypothetical protein
MATSKLLKKSEKKACEQIAAVASGLEGQRAAALLALNEGLTQTAAGAKAGLTLGQVRYMLSLFREKGMSLFAAVSDEKKSSSKAKKSAKKKDKPKKKDKGDKKKGKKSKKKK